MESIPTIGVGITSHNRPEHLKMWNNYLDSNPFGDQPYQAMIYEDKKGKGVAHSKNVCLKALKDCDYIFLFDDDCIPIKDKWWNFFIEASKETAEQHFLYLKPTSTIKKIGETDRLEFFNNCGGCFMFLTKEVIEKVGAFNKKYGRYGYEHAGYTKRIYEAGLTSEMYIHVKGAEDYITSFDYDFTSFRFGIDHKPSLLSEMNKIPTYMIENYKIFKEDEGFQQI